MPTYLVHGFRWHRPSIRIHVILNDLEDATPEWVLAPATSMSILNSLYTLYDFLPPSNPPPLAYAHIPIPPIPGDEDEDDEPPEERPQTATPKPKIRKARSMISLRSRSMSRKSTRPAQLAPPVNGNVNGHHGYNDRKGSTSGSDHRPSTASRSIHKETSKPKRPSFNDWSVVKLLEQYDPSDMAVSQPYAYVADYMVEVSLGVAVAEEMAKYEAKMKTEDGPMSPVTPGTHVGGPAKIPSVRDLKRKDRRAGWFEKLRDKLQDGEDIGWHVVVCGDEERAKPSMECIRGSLGVDDDEQLRTPRSAGFRGFFSKRNVHEE